MVSIEVGTTQVIIKAVGNHKAHGHKKKKRLCKVSKKKSSHKHDKRKSSPVKKKNRNIIYTARTATTAKTQKKKNANQAHANASSFAAELIRN